MLTAEGFSEARPFMRFGSYVFRSQLFQKYLSYEVTFFSKCLKFNVDSKKATKSSKIYLVFLIVAFELVTVNSPYYSKNTLHRQST